MIIAEHARSVSPVRGNGVEDELELLFEEAAALAGRLRKNARALHRPDNLSAAGRGLLRTLHLLGPLTVPQLARQRSTSRQNIQALVDRLAAAGYIEFKPNPAHVRSELVQLTGRGRVLLLDANRRMSSLLASLLPHLQEDEILGCASLLRKLRELLSGEELRPRPRRTPADGATTRPVARRIENGEALASPRPKPAGTEDHSAEEDGSMPVNLL